MAQYFDFQPNSLTAFSFPALLDGVQYNAVVTWNIFGLRWYLNLYSTQGTLVYSTPVVESPDGFDVSLLPASFTSVLVFRDSTKQFEVWDTPNTYPDFNAVPEWMLDSTLGKFVLDSSSLLANDVMFDAAGNPIILNQSTLQSEAMLDAMGGQFVLGPSSQVNQGTAVVTFANAPLTGAILTAVDALNNTYALGTGDGITQKFQTNPNVQLTLPAKIYKQDWQGNQLQYSTPRTNVALYSSNLTNGAWAALNCTSALSATLASDGLPYTQITPTTGGNRIQKAIDITVSQGAKWTVSCEVMPGTSNYAGLTIVDTATTYRLAGCIVNLTTGAVISTAGIGSPVCTTKQMPNGAWRISLSATMAPGQTACSFGVGVSDGATYAANIYPSAGSGTILASEMQFEAGAVSTSYIQTTTAPVTVTDYTETDGGSILASSQDLSSQAMLTGQRGNVTLDQSTIP